MEVKLNDLEKKLLAHYTDLHNKQGQPEWAYPVAPPIPFVGDNYPAEGGGVLVYASAENLGYTWPDSGTTVQGWKTTRPKRAGKWPWFTDELTEMQRSRMMLAREGGTRVHIEPINNGGLLVVARHILARIDGQSSFSDTPQGFLSEIAVANPGKFSIRPKDNARTVNKDYAKDVSKFKDQQDLIASDLEILNPRILIIPKTIYRSLKKIGLGTKLEKIEQTVVMRQVQLRAIYGRGRRAQPKAPKEDWVSTGGYSNWDAPYWAFAYIQWMHENPTCFNRRDSGMIDITRP